MALLMNSVMPDTVPATPATSRPDDTARPSDACHAIARRRRFAAGFRQEIIFTIRRATPATPPTLAAAKMMRHIYSPQACLPHFALLFCLITMPSSL